MRQRELTTRAAVVGGLLLVASFAIFHLLFDTAEPAVPAPPPLQTPPSPPPAVVQDDPPPPFVEDVPPSVPTVADLALRCGELIDPVDRGYPSADDASEDCQNALQARFSQAHSERRCFRSRAP